MAAKILIIEDDGVTQDLLRPLLGAREHKVWAMADGNAGVAAAMAYLPDLVLCDVNLPTINGFEVLERLRAASGTCHIPVIALTAAGAENDVAAAKVHDRIVGMGFTGYIPKPIDPKLFGQQVEAFLPTQS